MERNGITPRLPPVWHGQHLLGYLHECGPVMGTGMGAIPLTFGELQAWQERTGLDLQPWEVLTLRRLSKDYASESVRAANPAAKPPWTPPVVDRAHVNQQLRSIFGALAARQRQRASA